MAAIRRQNCSIFARQSIRSGGLGEFPEQTLGRRTSGTRGDGHVWLVPIALLHEPRVISDRYPPLLELAPVAVDGTQFHHHLVGVEVEDDVDLVREGQGKRAVAASRQTHCLAVEVD